MIHSSERIGELVKEDFFHEWCDLETDFRYTAHFANSCDRNEFREVCVEVSWACTFNYTLWTVLKYHGTGFREKRY